MPIEAVRVYNTVRYQLNKRLLTQTVQRDGKAGLNFLRNLGLDPVLDLNCNRIQIWVRVRNIYIGPRSDHKLRIRIRKRFFDIRDVVGTKKSIHTCTKKPELSPESWYSSLIAQRKEENTGHKGNKYQEKETPRNLRQKLEKINISKPDDIYVWQFGLLSALCGTLVVLFLYFLV